MIYIDNDTIQEGQSMSSEVHNARNSDIRILGSSSSGTATRGNCHHAYESHVCILCRNVY